MKDLINQLFNPVFDNTDDGNTNDGNTDDGNKDTNDNGDTPKVFTQEEVNTFLANDRRKLQEKYEKRIKQLETVRDNSNLSQKEIDELNNQIDEMRSEFKTKEQLAEEKRVNLEKEYKGKLKEVEDEAGRWRNNYTEMVINNGIITAAVENDAFNPDQITAILRPTTNLVEIRKDGKKTGKYEPKVTFTTKDEEGNYIDLELSPSEAVKRMSADERYANLFKTNLKGGLGDFSSGKSNSGLGDLKDTKNYLEQRKKGKTGTNNLR